MVCPVRSSRRLHVRLPLVALLLACVALGAPNVARAAEIRGVTINIDSELVKQGLAAYNDLEYARALSLLDQALRETLTRDEKIIAYQTMAFAHVGLNNRDAALHDFENLLRVDPSFELDRTISPRVRAVFEQAKAEVATGGIGGGEDNKVPTVPATVDFGAEKRAKEGHAIDVRATYPGGVAARGELFYRTRGQLVFSKTTALIDTVGRFEATVPGMDVHAPGLEYYLVILDERGSSLAQAGSLAQPLFVDIGGTAKAPIYKRAWFWGVIGGAIVVGAGVATAVALTVHPSVAASTPATITIMPK
jgi:hypothetical protein